MESAPSSPWHSMSAAEVLERLESSRQRGLRSSEAERRLERFGPNSLPEAKRRSPLLGLLRQFKSPLIYLLFVGAAAAFLLGERADAAVILAVVTLNAIIGALQEGRAERSMRALRGLAETQARVLRDGHEAQLHAHLLVPGDLVLLSAGAAIPADARVLEAVTLQVAEAALTGESVPSSKGVERLSRELPIGDRQNMVYAGTYVTRGRGCAIVVATGPASEVGKIAALTACAEEPKTPLERRVDRLGRVLVFVALGVFLLLFGVGVLRGVPIAQLLMVAISQLVSIVPEGLPVAMTIALAVGMQRMAARRTIVRRLAAVETLGSTTVICTDKTGTLTRNEMTVTRIELPFGPTIEVTGSGYRAEGTFLVDGRPVGQRTRADLEELLRAGALCNDGQLEAPQRPEDPFRTLGDPTELALLVAAEKAGLSVERLRVEHPRTAEVPFSSDYNWMATAHGGVVYLKGAPEALLPLCASALREGREAPLDEPSRALVRAQVEQLASSALRVLALARLERFEVGELHASVIAGEATLLGLAGQLDPPREEAKAAVRACHAAGIRTIMVTGDHLSTGLAVAEQLEIARAGDQAIEGAELASLREPAFFDRLDRLAVFARVHPVQKYEIVEALQRRGEVVAMTGDGVNDAPALARADIGVAMGITGTEVAKEAAKIVLTDDNFATLVHAVEEGRVVYRNIKKAVLLLLSTGTAEVLFLMTTLLLGYPLPLLAVQILWNNVVTEGTITVNLVMEPREGDEMRAPPISRDEPLLTRAMLGRLVLMSLSIAATTLGFFIYRLSQGASLEYTRTATFTLLAVCEWFNVINCRSATRSALRFDLLRNPWLVGGLLLSVVLQTAVVFVPFLNETFHTVPLPLAEVVWIGAVGSVVLWVEELRKLFARRRASASA